MRDGQVQDGRVWFGFDIRDLEWLYDFIPESDEFKKSIAKAITDLEQPAREDERQ